MSTPDAAPYIHTITGKHAIYYHTSWACYGRNFQVKDLAIDHITDIAYAFFNVGPDGKVFSGDPWADMENPVAEDGPGGNLGQFSKLKKQGKKFNMTLAVGGWSWSKHFSQAVATSQTRETFVASLTDIFRRYPGLFCGVSLDWEYLSDDGKNYGLDGNVATPQDADNFVKLLRLMRQRLPGFRLSMCVTAAPEKIKMPVERMHPLLDEVHLMTYDFMDGAWGGGLAGHHTNLRKREGCPYSVEQAVAAWRARGVPPQKLFIGVAFYSRGFSGTAGLGKPCTGGSPDKSWEDGVCDFKSLPRPGSREMFDPVAVAAYSYDPKRKVMNSYDTPQTVKEKCKFVHEHNLGGVLVWESSGDHPYAHPRSLTRAIHDALTHSKRP